MYAQVGPSAPTSRRSCRSPCTGRPRARQHHPRPRDRDRVHRLARRRSCPAPDTPSPRSTDADEAFAADRRAPARRPRHRRREYRGARAGWSSAARSGPRRRWRRCPILCVASSDDVEERIGFLEAGADDVIARPFDAREVEARVEALLLRFQRSKDLSPIVSTDGITLSRARRIVAVYSPKGGVGTTTIATNIAVVAAQRKSNRVVLVDLDLQFGGVATHLNLDPKQTLADVIRDEAALREPELLRTYAMRHDSGLHVLAAPPTPQAAELDHARPHRASHRDAARGLRRDHHRRRLHARRAGAQRVRGRRDRSCCRSTRRSPRSRRCTDCSTTSTRPAPSG